MRNELEKIPIDIAKQNISLVCTIWEKKESCDQNVCMMDCFDGIQTNLEKTSERNKEIQMETKAIAKEILHSFKSDEYSKQNWFRISLRIPKLWKKGLRNL